MALYGTECAFSHPITGKYMKITEPLPKDMTMLMKHSSKEINRFLEEHLLETIVAEEIAEKVYLSPFYFEKGFKLITGYTIGEYTRNRRLYLAVFEVVSGDTRVIDLAYKYGYHIPESFKKAFTHRKPNNEMFYGVSFLV